MNIESNKRDFHHGAVYSTGHGEKIVTNKTIRQSCKKEKKEFSNDNITDTQNDYDNMKKEIYDTVKRLTKQDPKQLTYLFDHRELYEQICSNKDILIPNTNHINDFKVSLEGNSFRGFPCSTHNYFEINNRQCDLETFDNDERINAIPAFFCMNNDVKKEYVDIEIKHLREFMKNVTEANISRYKFLNFDQMCDKTIQIKNQYFDVNTNNIIISSKHDKKDPWIINKNIDYFNKTKKEEKYCPTNRPKRPNTKKNKLKRQIRYNDT